MGVLLFIISALPVVVIGWYIWHQDTEKEPTKLLIKLFAGGLLSIVLTLLLTYLLSLVFPFMGFFISGQNFIELVLDVFIGVALVEEFSKWLVTYLFVFKHKEFDHRYDGIVYCVFVALGFAFFENLLYVYNGGLTVGIMRAFSAVPGHAAFGVLMGYYLELAKIADINKKKQLVKKNLLLSVLAPTVLHGVYDFCLMAKSSLFLVVFFVFVVFLYVNTLQRIKKSSSTQTRLKYKDNYCDNCGWAVSSDYCPGCGRKND